VKKSPNQSERVRLQSLYVFPLKSAGALSRDKMRFHMNGTPLLDRIYCVASGTSRQVVQGKHLPKLAKIKPRMDSTNSRFILHYTGTEDLMLEKDEEDSDENGNKTGISVCEEGIENIKKVKFPTRYILEYLLTKRSYFLSIRI